MKSINQLLSDIETLKKKLSELGSPLNNNEAWSIQQQLQVSYGQLLVGFQEVALEKGVERDLWNIGFRTTITQLQTETKEKKKGDTQAKDVLNWFLNSASGFYLQLLNQISSANSLDLIFRRKDSVYGLIGGCLSSVPGTKTKDSETKNALYLCQYCLIHLGDLARYRHQAKQAETFYRHAVTVAATSGHPYNQLALLEAGRGNKLASVFLYIRALCVTAPFPGAPSNLIQTLAKVLSNKTKEDGDLIKGEEVKVGTLTRMTKDEYIGLFLHFHSNLLLKGDLETASADIPHLSSALSMLVATTTLTRSSLVQMFAINVFAHHYFSGKAVIKVGLGDENSNKKEEEKFIEPKECEGALDLIENLMVVMIAALLLPVHTMKEPEVVMAYPALPAIRLMFEWILLEDKILSPALKKKQQIWPGLCSLVNFIQKPITNVSFDEYKETPLPEDWDLQGYQPLSKIISRYKYKEGTRLTPDKYSLIRAKRLTDLATRFSLQIVEGGAVIRKSWDDNQSAKFEAQSSHSPSAEEVMDLERLTLQPPQPLSGKKLEKVGILKPQGSLERAKESKDIHTKEKKDFPQSGGKQILKDGTKDLKTKSKAERKIKIGAGDKRIPISGSNTSILVSGDSSSSHSETADAAAPVSSKPRMRTNVALQAILKRNSTNQETKQVTFQTPSPATSPNPSDASNESQRSQLSSPPLMSTNQQGKPPQNLLGVPNVNAGRFPPYRSLDYPVTHQANPAFSSMSFHSAAQNINRPENPYSGHRPPTNNSVGPGLTVNVPEVGTFSQHLLRQPPPTYQPPLRQPSSNLFPDGSKESFSPDAFPSSNLPMPSFSNVPSSSPWNNGSLNGPKCNLLMGNLRNNPLSPGDRLLEPQFKDMTSALSSQFQQPQTPFQQPAFQSQQRQFPFSNQEIENRTLRPTGLQTATTAPMFLDTSYGKQQTNNPGASKNMASLFAQGDSLIPASNISQLSSLSPKGISQGDSMSNMGSVGPGPSMSQRSIGANSGMNLGSVTRLGLNQGSSSMGGFGTIGSSMGTSGNINLRTNIGPSSNIGLGSNVGPRNPMNSSSDFFSGGPTTSWWDKEPPNPTSTSIYLSQLMNRAPPLPFQNVRSTSVDTSIPPPSHDGSHFSNIGSTSSHRLSTLAQNLSPEHHIASECGNTSARPTNTYSLFGPLGGGESLGGPTASPHHLLTSQQHQPDQSLWSGPSPLQRLLEQKKYSSNK